MWPYFDRTVFQIAACGNRYQRVVIFECTCTIFWGVLVEAQREQTGIITPLYKIYHNSNAIMGIICQPLQSLHIKLPTRTSKSLLCRILVLKDTSFCSHKVLRSLLSHKGLGTIYTNRTCQADNTIQSFQ